jgi:TolA-binding protein
MRILVAVAVMIAALGYTAPAQAQSALEMRIDRLEREMRAVQRKIFPGGAGATFEPEITAETANGVPGAPASSPIADLTQRVAALESQIATLTGQVEQAQNRIRLLEDAFAAYKRSTDARIKALEDTASSVPTREVEQPVIEEPARTPTRPTPRPTPPATSGSTTTTTTPAAPKPSADASRAERLAAVQKPAGTDPAEVGYVYGFRLWEGKFYPEARKELEQVVAKYPNHRRASYAANLLGRAYLDGGAPSLAAKTFFDNYTKNPNGERAADSLYYLAQALEQLKKPSSEICRVYNELDKGYGTTLSAEMRAGMIAGRAKHKCK